MTHAAAWERLPDLLVDRDDRELLSHVTDCHLCQEHLFRLARVDRVLHAEASARRRFPARRVATAAIALVAAAAFAGAVLVQAPASPPARFALRAADGTVVAHAQIERGEGENGAVVFTARGMPAAAAATYLLWTRSPGDGDAVLVGRFMVSDNGECRARFSLAGTREPDRFWVTPAGREATVVAST